MSLFRRVVAINAGVLVSAAILLAVSPATVSPTLQFAEGGVLAVGTLLMISVNLVLLRRVFGPLEQLTGPMRRVDPHAPGRRIELEHADAQVTDLCTAFNSMLDRLEDERRRSGRRAVAAPGELAAHAVEPPREHPREARHARPRRAHPLRDRPRARRAMIGQRRRLAIRAEPCR